MNKELSISLHVSSGQANIKGTHLEKAYQSTPVLLVTDGSRIVLSNCTFESNKIQKGTAAVAIYGSSATVNHFTFTNNVGENGGVIYGQGNTNINVNDSIFEGNSAYSGGVFFVSQNMMFSIESSKFMKNIAHHYGGVIFGSEKTSLRISHCNFTRTKPYLPMVELLPCLMAQVHIFLLPHFFKILQVMMVVSCILLRTTHCTFRTPIFRTTMQNQTLGC